MSRMWPAVVELVRGGNAMLGVLLESARPTAVTERELVLGLPGRGRLLQAQGRAGRLPPCHRRGGA